MKRRRNRDPRGVRVLRLWEQADAARAVPYLRSVVGSLREHWLEAQSKRRDRERLDRQPGRADRQRILAGQELHATQEAAEDRFNDAVQELVRIDVYLVDPVQGVVLIPFRKDDDLAWVVQIAPSGIRRASRRIRQQGNGIVAPSAHRTASRKPAQGKVKTAAQAESGQGLMRIFGTGRLEPTGGARGCQQQRRDQPAISRDRP